MRPLTLLVVFGSAVIAGGCGGVASGPQSDAFAAALNQCSYHSGESQQREACVRDVMQRFEGR